MSKITDLANGHWPSILGALANLTADQLTDKHQPCPLCGGEDRYRFDDREGNGTWFCNQCGGPDCNGGAGNGLTLLMRRNNWSFKEAATRIEHHLGITPERPNPPTTAKTSSFAVFPTSKSVRFISMALHGAGKHQPLLGHSSTFKH